MTLRDQRAFAIRLGGCDPGAQSCCPRSARNDGLTDPDNGPDAVRHARSPARLPGVRSRAAMRLPCSEQVGRFGVDNSRIRANWTNCPRESDAAWAGSS
jgi:hypothetical protein